MSKLSNERLESLRFLLLLEASQALRPGFPVSKYHTCARVAGFDVALQEIERELLYLFDKGLLVEVPKFISPEIVCYRIHASGRDLLARNHLEDLSGREEKST
jgi:hypothetical protein